MATSIGWRTASCSSHLHLRSCSFAFRCQTDKLQMVLQDQDLIWWIIERYKARLMAREFSQKYGIDYEETFAPATKMTSIHTLIFIVSAHKWPLYQMDVKNAFLNSDLYQIVNMQPPSAIFAPLGDICHLCRAIYSLKQALSCLVWEVLSIRKFCWLCHVLLCITMRHYSTSVLCW